MAKKKGKKYMPVTSSVGGSDIQGGNGSKKRAIWRRKGGSKKR